MERLGSYLKYTYINEYVGFWRDYLTHIKARDGIALKPLLSQLTQDDGSPLQQLNKGVRHFVNIPLITIDKPKETQPQAPKKIADKVNKASKIAETLLPDEQDLTMLMAQEQNEIATKINQAFDDNVLLSGSSKQVAAIHESLHKDLTALKSWLDKADNEVIPGKAYFDDVTKNKSYQSFANLWLNSYDQTLIDNLIIDIVNLTSVYVEQKVADYLNEQWQAQVAMPYNKQLAPFFPFADNNDSVSIRTLDKFFAADSSLAQFEQNVLNEFVK